MKGIIYTLSVGAVVIMMPFSVYAADILISGAGEATANGCYVDQGGGLWLEQYVANKICTYDGGGGDLYAILTPQASTCGAGAEQYYVHVGTVGTLTAANIISAGTWINSSATWANPVPTPTATTCGGGGGGGGDTGATSTTEQTQQNLFFAFCIFFTSFFGTIWLLRKH